MTGNQCFEREIAKSNAIPELENICVFLKLLPLQKKVFFYRQKKENVKVVVLKKSLNLDIAF